MNIFISISSTAQWESRGAPDGFNKVAETRPCFGFIRMEQLGLIWTEQKPTL